MVIFTTVTKMIFATETLDAKRHLFEQLFKCVPLHCQGRTLMEVVDTAGVDSCRKIW